MQVSFDRLTDSLDPEATVRVDQHGAVQDRERTDVLRPAKVVRP